MTLSPPEDLETLMQGVTVACIGPITADTARNLGFNIHIIAESYTIPGLCEAIKQHYSTRVNSAFDFRCKDVLTFSYVLRVFLLEVRPFKLFEGIFEKRSILFKAKEGDSFNHKTYIEYFED